MYNFINVEKKIMKIYTIDELWSRCEIEFVENENKENVIHDDAVTNPLNNGGQDNED